DTGQRKNKNMEELMKMIVKRTVLAVCILVLALILSTAASAACTGFDDVLETADCYESVIYLAEHEITQGTGNGSFSPDAPVTVRQWAMMLCRAYEVKVEGSSWSELSQNAVEQSCRKGWLNETALSTPNIQLCRGALLKSAFAAAKIPVYDSVLYESGVSLPNHENCIRIGKELQLCGEEDDANEIVTRRDAAMLLHAILTRAFTVTAPAAPVTLVNAAGVNINDYEKTNSSRGACAMHPYALCRGYRLWQAGKTDHRAARAGDGGILQPDR
ncbi:MAG: S-layer homology domain-containing protein, partial [Dysosmobacter sp.]|uniref:S-layer homology domain-containing protein n=1 Tax=Dysosmobacter sp. TaxID=2591382 RepID=UPI00267365D8